MKRILALFAAAMFTGQVLADSFTYNGLKYTVTNEATHTVMVDQQNLTSPSGDIVISDKAMNNDNGVVYTVTEINYLAFWNCTKITSVTLPNTVTKIGNDAFKGCEGLTSINIPNSVTEIGTSAFQGCTSLTSISIPSSVTTMAYGVFYACNNNLTIYCEAASQPTTGWDEGWNSGNYTVVWGYTVDSDPNNFSFSGSIEDGVRSGSITKYYGTANAVIIPSSFTINGETYPVTKIGSNAFYNKTKLVSVTIPNTVTSIGNYAFDGCSSLTSITIPNSVTSIGNCVFEDCSKLTKINVDSDNTAYSSVDGVLFNKDTTTLICYPAAKTGTTYTIPNSVTTIIDFAFFDCSKLTSITIPDSVTSIGYCAFSYCSKLTSITIPNSVTGIGSTAFYKCSSLTTVTLSNSVTSIGSSTFYNCSKLTSISIPNSVTYIGDQAFYGCSSLTSVTISDSVTRIGSDAFRDCSKLTSVTIPNSVTSIEDNAFRHCTNLESITIPSSVTSIGIGTIAECTKLTSINLDNKNKNFVTVDGVLYNADTTTLLGYPSGVTDTVFEIPNTVKKIQYGSITNCANLKRVIIPNSVTRIEWWAFTGCIKLDTLVIPNSVTYIGQGAFNNCNKLQAVYIPNSVTYMGDRAFKLCSSATFYCEAKAAPINWDDDWCPSNATVIWQELDATDPDYPELAVNVDDFTFTPTSSVEPYTAKITGYTGTNPNVVLPRKVTIDGKVHAVTELSANVFDNNKIIMAVYIPNTITSVGSKAFNENYELTIYCEANCDFETHPAGWANNWFGSNNSYFSVVGNTIVAGWYIYQIYNTSNRKLTIQRYIGHENQVTVRDTAIINKKYYYTDSIAYQAFWRCDSIKELTIPKAFTKVANYAFMYCDSLKKLTYNTNAIGSTFSNHRSLKQIEIGDNVTSLANWAFGGCSDLEEVTFGESVKTVGSNAFAGCSKLKKVNLKSIKGLCSTDFDIYDSNPLEKAHHLYIDSVEVTRFAIPEGVTKIGARAFSGGSSIDSVYIPAAVTTIGANAFAGCSALTIYCEAASQPSDWDAKWNPDKRPVKWGVTNLGNMKPDSTNFNFTITNDSLCEVKVTKYYGTSGNMVIPAKTTIDGKEYTVTSIGYEAFYNNKKIIWATIPNTVTEINTDAFQACTNLESVTIPSSVTYIGTSPFYETTKLKAIDVDADNEYYVSIDGVLFSADKKRLLQYPSGKTDTLYKVPKHVETIYNYAINNCPYLKTMIISNTVENLNAHGIMHCDNMERLYIPKSVTYIGQDGVYGCDTVTIYCEAESEPWNWSSWWNEDKRPVVWGYDMQKFFPQLVLMAADSTSFTFRYNAENSTAEIIKYNGSSNNVVIPAKVVKDNVEYKIVGIDGECFLNNDTLMQVSIPKTVRTIGAKAFAGCSELTIYCEVHTKPGGWDSKWNPNQQTVVWGAYDEDVVVNPVNTPIPENPYAGVEVDSTNFHFWVINDSLRYVEVDGYTGSLGNIVIPSTTTINNIKYTVTTIDQGAFSGNNTIVSVVIPNTVTTIESNAFGSCKNLEYVVIPSSVKSIGNGPFRGCTKLTAIYVEDDNKDYISIDGVLYNADMTYIMQYPSGKSGSSYTILKTASYINDYAFYNCPNLTSLSIPDNVKSIYYYGISYCDNLSRLVIPKSVTYIEQNAIRYDKNLTIYCEAESKPWNWSSSWNYDDRPVVWGYTEDSDAENFTFSFNASDYTAEVTGYTDTSKYIAIPRFVMHDGEEYTVTSIGTDAFLNNKTITSVTIPGSVTTIKSKAFRHCDSLNYVYIPSSVTTIGDGPFSESNCLTAIHVDGQNKNYVSVDGVLYTADMKQLVQYPCLKADTLFKVPAQVVSINYGAFSGCPNLTTVVLPDTAATLKGWAVSDCGNLNRLVIPKTVTTIEDDAIRNCNNLTIYCEAESKPAGWATNWNRDSRPVVWNFSLDILDTSSNPDDFTFYTYSDGTAEVTGYYGIYSKIIIPSKITKDGKEYTVTVIGDQAFRDNTTIVSVVIPNTVTDIESNAFRNCKNLESVEIPKSVTYIGLGPFCESNKLTEIKIDSNNKNFVAVDGVLYTADMRVLVQYPCNKADASFTVPYGVETIEYGAFSNCPNLITLTLPSSTTEINWWAICGCGNLKGLYIPISVTSIESDAIRYCKNLTIYCEAEYEPWGWAWDWNYDNYTVIWNTEMGSAVDESAATAVNIYAYGNTIVVENATEDVYVYNAMGGLVTRTTSATITINGTGVYIVKTGNVVKRVMINEQ